MEVNEEIELKGRNEKRSTSNTTICSNQEKSSFMSKSLAYNFLELCENGDTKSTIKSGRRVLKIEKVPPKPELMKFHKLSQST